jgi:hypothetical protein
MAPLNKKKMTTLESNELDGDGVPFPDEETLNAWRAQAITEQPNSRDWAELVVMLRWATELERPGATNPRLPAGMTAPEYALRAVLHFLERQPSVMRHSALAPLLRLRGAIVDLADGRISPLLKPVARPVGNPGKGQHEAFRMGMAARTMSELMEGGASEHDAARRVARALGGKISGVTVRNWRARLNEGHGSGAPQAAIEHYRAPLPPGLGDTPKLRGENLLKRLKMTSLL